MAHVDLLDATLRDGQQSLWGMRMQAGMALPVAPLIDRSGFRVIDLAGSSLFEAMGAASAPATSTFSVEPGVPSGLPPPPPNTSMICTGALTRAA